MNAVKIPKEVTDTNFKAVCRQVVKSMKKLPIPGLALGIFHEGQEFSAGFGVTSVDNPLPVHADTLFQAGSISKTLTATLIMKLVEMGKLDLDVPIRTYLPDLCLADESVAQQVTMRHLLTHTGGWDGDYFDDFGSGDDALAKSLSALAKLPQLTPLGTVWAYNNAGFYIAGRVIEVLTGKTYEAAVQETLFTPLGMDRSFYYPSDVLITYRFAIGHNVDKNIPSVAHKWAVPRCGAPVGGLVTNVRDLLKYARQHIGHEPRLLSDDSLKQMQTPLFSASGDREIGLSWFIRKIRGVQFIGHGGATNGQNADLLIVPEKQFAIALLSNSDYGSASFADIEGVAFKTYLGLRAPKPREYNLPEDKLGQFVGLYEAAMVKVELKVEDGRLKLIDHPKGGFPTPDSPPPPPTPPSRLMFYGKDKIIASDDPLKGSKGDFIRDPQKNIVWLRMFGRILKKL